MEKVEQPLPLSDPHLSHHYPQLLSQAQGSAFPDLVTGLFSRTHRLSNAEELKMLENLLVVVLLTFLLRKKDKINERSYLASISMRKLVENILRSIYSN